MLSAHPAAEPPVRVLIVDDDAIARRALREAVAGADGLEIAGEAGDGAEALGRLDGARPDVIIVDGDVIGLDVLVTTLRGREEDPAASVLVLSVDVDEDQAVRVLQAGAVGYLGKGVPVDAILRAARAVGHGEAAVSRRLTRRLVLELQRTARRSTGMRPVNSRLTSREWEVLDLLTRGASTLEIAERLSLSTDTVRSHVKHLLHKLGAHSRAEAVAIAERMRSPGSEAEDG